MDTTTPLGPLAALSDALAAAVARAAEGVVSLDDAGRGASAILWADGLVVTAEEPLAQDEGLKLGLADGAEVTGELAGRDPSTDVALIRAETPAAPAWTPAALPPAGALVLAVGRGPSGPRAAFGIVAESGPAWDSDRGGRIDALLRLGFPMPPGIEGGAVVDASGNLVGLAAADPRRRGLVIPTATVARAVERIAEKGYVGRGYLGLGLRPAKGATGQGLLVVELAEGGPAAAAGVLLGDLLTACDDAAVGRMRDLSRRLGTESVGRPMRLALLRGGAPAEILVTVGERPRG